jgi:catalase
LKPDVQPNYIPNDGGTISISASADTWSGQVQEYESQAVDSDYDQPRELWKDFMKNTPMDKNFISNVAMNLSMAREDVRRNTYSRLWDLVAGT